MNVDQKRTAIYNAYSSDNWKKKVLKMSDEQVTAIYLRLVSKGKI